MLEKNKTLCCETYYFQIAMRSFAVLYLLLVIMVHNAVASETVAIPDIIKKAEALIFDGNAAEAYKLLAPLEPELAGVVDFDYLLGVAALDSGNPAKATLVFERVLLSKPNFAGARLDMGRAYFAMGNYIMARREFHKVLKLNPPSFARTTTIEYLDAVNKQLNPKQTFFSCYSEFTGGYDNNINTSTDDSMVYFPFYSVDVILADKNVKTGDGYGVLGAGFNLDHRIFKNLSCDISGTGKKRAHFSKNDFNTANIDVTGNIRFQTSTNFFKFGLKCGRFFLEDSTNRENLRGDLEWRHMINPGNLLVTFGQYSIVQHPEMEINNFNQTLLGLSWLYSPGWIEKTVIITSAYAGKEDDTDGRADGKKQFGGLMTGFEVTPIKQLSVFAGAGGQFGSYNKENPAFLEKREDRLFDARAGLKWTPAKNISVKPQINFIQNNSNIQIYEYSRTDLSVTFRYDYK